MTTALFAVRSSVDEVASYAVANQLMARVYPSRDDGWVMVEVPLLDELICTTGPPTRVEDAVKAFANLQIPVFATDDDLDYVAWSPGTVEPFEGGVGNLPFWGVDADGVSAQTSRALAVVAKHEVPDLVLTATAMRRSFSWVCRGTFTVVAASDVLTTDRALAAASAQRRCAGLRIAVTGDEVEIVAVQDARLVARQVWNGAARVVGEEFVPLGHVSEARGLLSDPPAEAHQFTGLRGFFVDRSELAAMDASLRRGGVPAELLAEFAGFMHLPDPELIVGHLLGTRVIEDEPDSAIATPEASTIAAIRTAMRTEDELGVGWSFTRARNPTWDAVLALGFLPFLVLLGGVRLWQVAQGTFPGGLAWAQLIGCAVSLPSCVSAARRVLARRRGQTA
jgi:hypothetical protein